jgi:hypothetical protein
MSDHDLEDEDSEPQIGSITFCICGLKHRAKELDLRIFGETNSFLGAEEARGLVDAELDKVYTKFRIDHEWEILCHEEDEGCHVRRTLFELLDL